MVASPGTIIVARTIMNSTFLPLNSRKENANAAREQVMIWAMVILPAIMKEFNTKRNSGMVVKASIKFCKVGFFGNRFSSVVNSSPEGINAMLTAYSRGSRIRIANTMLTTRRPPVRIRLLVSAFAFISCFSARSCSLLIVFWPLKAILLD